MKTETIREAQWNLYRWMGQFEKRSRQQIKEVCEYLNLAMDLSINGNTMWAIFYPLVYNGIIDHVGSDYWALTDPISLDYKDHAFLVNMSAEPDDNLPVGFHYFSQNECSQDLKHITLSTINMLRHCPSIKEVIESWETSIIDRHDLNYQNKDKNQGIAFLSNNENKKYFCIPQKSFIREIPDFKMNPDARNIAQYYERSINEEVNGFIKNGNLYLHAYGLPFLLYRILMIDGLAIKKFPTYEENHVIFYNLGTKVFKELNRILCNSISYE